MQTLILLIALGLGHFSQTVVFSDHTEVGQVYMTQETITADLGHNSVQSWYAVHGDTLVAGDVSFVVENHADAVWLIPTSESVYKRIELRKNPVQYQIGLK